jgi:putative FmdB family regulatory protein
MPIYDYRCKECGIISELLLRNPNHDVRCPGCGSADMERLVSASYTIQVGSKSPGTTCCGRAERCEKPPCAGGETCRRD